MAQYDDELDDDETIRERKGGATQVEDEPAPPVRLPAVSQVASPLDNPKPMPSISSPVPAGVPIVAPPTQIPHPDPFHDYNARIASPHGISTIHNPLLRGLAHVGDIAGTALAPGITGLIPGTTLNEHLQDRQALNRGKNLETENQDVLKDTNAARLPAKTEAETNEANARVEALRRPPKPTLGWRSVPTLLGPNGEPVEVNEETGEYRYGQLAGAHPVHTPAETAAQDKQAFEKIVGKVADAGLPTGPQQLDKSLDAALKSGAITQAEHSQARGFQSANATPATNLTVHVAGGEALQTHAAAVHDANQFYRWKDPTSGQIVEGRGTKVPQGVEGDPIGTDKDFAQHQREGKMSNAVQQSFNRLAEDIDNHPEVFDNPTARNIMATTLEQIDRTSAGMLVAGTGGTIPLPSGMGDMINTALQNKALDDKTARALKDYIADYRGMKDMAVVMQMEMQGGRIGRGSQQVFQAIVNQLPNGSTPDSQTAKRLIQNFQQKQDVIQSEHADAGKEKAYQPKQGGGTEIPEGTKGTWRGQAVVRKGGKWVLAQ